MHRNWTASREAGMKNREWWSRRRPKGAIHGPVTSQRIAASAPAWTPAGNPRIEVLDAQGKIVARLPEK
jgi:hypothetical protein